MKIFFLFLSLTLSAFSWDDPEETILNTLMAKELGECTLSALELKQLFENESLTWSGREIGAKSDALFTVAIEPEESLREYVSSAKPPERNAPQETPSLFSWAYWFPSQVEEEVEEGEQIKLHCFNCARKQGVMQFNATCGPTPERYAAVELKSKRYGIPAPKDSDANNLFPLMLQKLFDDPVGTLTPEHVIQKAFVVEGIEALKDITLTLTARKSETISIV